MSESTPKVWTARQLFDAVQCRLDVLRNCQEGRESANYRQALDDVQVWKNQIADAGSIPPVGAEATSFEALKEVARAAAKAVKENSNLVAYINHQRCPVPVAQMQRYPDFESIDKISAALSALPAELRRLIEQEGEDG